MHGMLLGEDVAFVLAFVLAFAFAWSVVLCSVVLYHVVLAVTS